LGKGGRVYRIPEEELSKLLRDPKTNEPYLPVENNSGWNLWLSKDRDERWGNPMQHYIRCYSPNPRHLTSFLSLPKPL